MNRIVFVVLLATVLTGCTLAPKYQRPAPAISPNWPAEPGSASSGTNAAPVPAADIGWHEFFRDPRLRQLIELALTNNPDLRVPLASMLPVGIRAFRWT